MQGFQERAETGVIALTNSMRHAFRMSLRKLILKEPKKQISLRRR